MGSLFVVLPFLFGALLFLSLSPGLAHPPGKCENGTRDFFDIVSHIVRDLNLNDIPRNLENATTAQLFSCLTKQQVSVIRECQAAAFQQLNALASKQKMTQGEDAASDPQNSSPEGSVSDDGPLKNFQRKPELFQMFIRFPERRPCVHRCVLEKMNAFNNKSNTIDVVKVKSIIDNTNLTSSQKTSAIRFLDTCLTSNFTLPVPRFLSNMSKNATRLPGNFLPMNSSLFMQNDTCHTTARAVICVVRALLRNGCPNLNRAALLRNKNMEWEWNSQDEETSSSEEVLPAVSLKMASMKHKKMGSPSSETSSSEEGPGRGPGGGKSKERRPGPGGGKSKERRPGPGGGKSKERRPGPGGGKSKERRPRPPRPQGPPGPPRPPRPPKPGDSGRPSERPTNGDKDPAKPDKPDEDDDDDEEEEEDAEVLEETTSSNNNRRNPAPLKNDPSLENPKMSSLKRNNDQSSDDGRKPSGGQRRTGNKSGENKAGGGRNNAGGKTPEGQGKSGDQSKGNRREGDGPRGNEGPAMHRDGNRRRLDNPTPRGNGTKSKDSSDSQSSSALKMDEKLDDPALNSKNVDGNLEVSMPPGENPGNE